MLQAAQRKPAATPEPHFLLNDGRIDDGPGGGGLAGIGINQVDIVAVIVQDAAHVVPADLQAGAGQLRAGGVRIERAAKGVDRTMIYIWRDAAVGNQKILLLDGNAGAHFRG